MSSFGKADNVLYKMQTGWIREAWNVSNSVISGGGIGYPENSGMQCNFIAV